jgi:hypothetical protein
MTGIPDISVVYKGFSVWIEVKSPDNPKGPTDVQLHRMDQIRSAGGVVILARSLAQVKEALLDIDARIEKGKTSRSKASKRNYGTPVA